MINLNKAGALFLSLLFLSPPALSAERTLELQHFKLITQREINKRSLLNIRRSLINARRKVGKLFAGTYPEEKISVIFIKEDLFRKNSPVRMHISGYYDGRIHLHESTVEEGGLKETSVLYHEYAHALVHLLSRGYCDIWLSEAMAVYTETELGNVAAWRNYSSEFIPTADLEKRMKSLGGRGEEEIQALYHQAYLRAKYLHSRYHAKAIADALEAIAAGKSTQKGLKQALNMSYETLDRAIQSTS